MLSLLYIVPYIMKSNHANWKHILRQNRILLTRFKDLLLRNISMKKASQPVLGLVAIAIATRGITLSAPARILGQRGAG